MTGRPFSSACAWRWFRWLPVLLALSLAACAGRSAGDLYAGQAARADNQAAIAAVAGQEIDWSTADLSIHYMAAPAGDLMDINGFVEFSSNLGKFPTLNYFRIYIHFIDAQGIILETRLLWSVASNSEARFVRWSFQRQFPLPAGAQAVGFSYRGSVSEGGGDGSFAQTRTGWEVRRNP
jgi:hypothetical protein